MNEVKLLELLCKVRAIEATLLAGPYKKDYLTYLSYFDAKIIQEMQEEMDERSAQAGNDQ